MKMSVILHAKRNNTGRSDRASYVLFVTTCSIGYLMVMKIYIDCFDRSPSPGYD